MKPLISRSVVRPRSLLALGVAMLLAVLLAMPTPAQAHDTLLSTDPADGSTLETSPEAITFDYSADILDVSPLVRVTDESGEQVAEIVPTIEGPTATATLPEPLPSGTYDIQWRVVSSDGHPIEGTLSLTIEQDPATEDAAAGAEGDAEPSDGGGEAAETSEEAAQDSSTPAEDSPEDASAEGGEQEETGGGIPMPVLLGILGVIVVGAVAAVLVIVRRRD